MLISTLKIKVLSILNFIEKYTKTDIVYLMKGGFWISSNKFVSAIRAFALSIIFANFLPREIFGQYKYVLAIFSTLTIFTLTGMRLASVRAAAKGMEGVITLALKTSIKYSLLGSAVSFGVSAWFFYKGDSTLAISLFIVGIFLPFIDTFSLFNSYLQGKKLFAQMAKFQFISEAFSLVFLIPAIIFSNNLYIILLAFFAPYTLVRIILWIYIKNKFNYNQSLDTESLTYGKHLSLISALTIIAGQIDKIILWSYLGGGAVAILNFAAAFPIQAQSQIKILQVLALPKFSERAIPLIKESLLRKIFLGSVLLIPLVVIYILIAPLLFKILFPQYMDAVFYSQIYSLSIIFSPKFVITTFLEAHAKKKELYITNICSPLIRIVLLIVLSIFYGILGTVMAILIENFLSYLLLIFIFKKCK